MFQPTAAISTQEDRRLGAGIIAQLFRALVKARGPDAPRLHPRLLRHSIAADSLSIRPASSYANQIGFPCCRGLPYSAPTWMSR
jgi:hypothetical protein